MGSHSKDKSHRDKEEDREKKDKDRHRSRKDRDTSRHHKSSKSRSKNNGSTKVVDDDPEDEELWVEKGAEDAEEPDSIANIPTRDSLAITSRASPSTHPPALPHAVAAESDARERRDEWMLEDAAVAPRRSAPVRQSDNAFVGGTFSVGETPTGIARPNKHDSNEQFTDGYGEGDVGTKGTFGGDFFSSLGSERRRKEDPKKIKVNPDQPKMSSRELNTGIYAEDGTRLPSSVEAIARQPASNSNTADGTRPPVPGSSGSSWRMMKLRRTYEAAEEENRPVQEVGIERFGSLELFEAAQEERRFLDGRSSGQGHGGLAGRQHDRGARSFENSRSGTPASATGTDDGLDEFGREKRREGTPQARYVFQEVPSANSSRPPSRSGSFRRPGSNPDEGGPSSRAQTPTQQRREQQASKPSTPIPSVFTPPIPSALASTRKPSQLQMSTTASDAVEASQRNEQLLSKPPMSPTSLNRLQAKILRARLMGGDSAELKAMEEEYERESARARQGDAGQGYFDRHDVGTSTGQQTDNTEVRVLPTLDGYGRLYDIGRGEDKEEDQTKLGPGNKRKRKEKLFETRDKETGELLRYNADDDQITLEEMVRQERFGGGARDQTSMDAEMAARITTDAKFEDDLDYMDDSAERLARKKIRTESQKKMFAINDYAKTKKALDSCQFCYQDTETTTVPPQAAMVALGTRTYLALPLFEPLVEGHTLIVPLQHHLSMLEADDDTWDEVRNFMKTLMQMYAQQDKGVMFYETVLSLRGQRHTYIEAVPVPWEHFEELPAYFRESILTSEAEWSQHKKLIEFDKRPGGFRRAMVPNLPYFMVQWDYKGEKGFGHVIEGPETADGAGDGYDEDEGAKGGGQFERYFAAEIIGNILDVNPRLWRKPRRMDRRLNEERIKKFRKGYDAYDWTKMLSQTSDA